MDAALAGESRWVPSDPALWKRGPVLTEPCCPARPSCIATWQRIAVSCPLNFQGAESGCVDESVALMGPHGEGDRQMELPGWGRLGSRRGNQDPFKQL